MPSTDSRFQLREKLIQVLENNHHWYSELLPALRAGDPKIVFGHGSIESLSWRGDLLSFPRYLVTELRSEMLQLVVTPEQAAAGCFAEQFVSFVEEKIRSEQPALRGVGEVNQ